MTSQNPTTAGSRPVAPLRPPRSGVGLYFLLLAVQTAGAAIILGNGVPIYRQLARDFARHQPQPGILWWEVAGVALIQTGYWLRPRLQLGPPQVCHVFISHLAGFVARLTFILASSTFALMFFVRFDQLPLTPPRIVMVLALLFSMFCYTLELERLAKAFQGPEGKT
jgi:hypothetical protein